MSSVAAGKSLDLVVRLRHVCWLDCCFFGYLRSSATSCWPSVTFIACSELRNRGLLPREQSRLNWNWPKNSAAVLRAHSR